MTLPSDIVVVSGGVALTLAQSESVFGGLGPSFRLLHVQQELARQLGICQPGQLKRLSANLVRIWARANRITHDPHLGLWKMK